MRLFLALLLLTLVCTCTSTPLSRTAPSPGKTGEIDPSGLPNILFILTDDQGIGDLSLHGNDSIRTPNMDALLTSGARFSRFYVSPVCAPTRASFLSGMYAPRTGAVFVTRRRETMDDGIMTIPEYLRHAGYRTGLFGKWHNGATAPYDPAGQGFDQFLGFTLGHFNDYFNGELQNERNELVPFSGDLTQILTDTAAAFMLEDREDPFFCMLTYQAPHTPVQVADKYWDAVKSRGLTDYNTGIYAMIESVDDRIGQLLDRLEQAGKLDNTIIIFSTDNGPNGDRYRMGLKGTKGQVDEGSVRVPFGIKFPGRHYANGKIFREPAGHIDLVPTLLDIVDLPIPESVDGRSLMLKLAGAPRVAMTDTRPYYAFKQGYNFTGYPASIRSSNLLTVMPSAEKFEVYDLGTDPGQHNDLMLLSNAEDNSLVQLARQAVDRYPAMIKRISRPDLVAPPINLDAAVGPVRLLAHEGEPRGKTRFMDKYGWANDFFVNLGQDGAYWPLETQKTRDYRVTIRYQLDAKRARTLVLSTDKGNERTIDLPPALAAEIPVADRVKRKEVYPRRWAEIEVAGFSISAGTKELRVKGGVGDGLWVKEVTLR